MTSIRNQTQQQITNEKPPWLEESEAGSPQREPFQKKKLIIFDEKYDLKIANAVQCHFLSECQ